MSCTLLAAQRSLGPRTEGLQPSQCPGDLGAWSQDQALRFSEGGPQEHVLGYGHRLGHTGVSGGSRRALREGRRVPKCPRKMQVEVPLVPTTMDLTNPPTTFPSK